jgi:hypothetical protein
MALLFPDLHAKDTGANNNGQGSGAWESGNRKKRSRSIPSRRVFL